MSEELCVMILKGDAKFEGKLTRGLKNGIRKLVNFHASSRISENLHFDIFRWKNTEELCLMTLKSDTKFQEKLTLGSKNDTRNLVNFNASSGISENLLFDLLHLLIVYYVWAKKVLRNYVSRHWRKEQNLKRNWLVPNTRKSLNLHFNGNPFD